MSAPVWTPVAPLADLAPGSLRTFKRGPHQLVIARTGEGLVHALDNRCPHEGYPLAQGELKGCALTCAWHNWKFDVRDGACTVGGEPVRAYATRVVEGEVQVDLADPDPETSIPAWRASLLEGLSKHDNGRAIRDGVRLVAGGYDPAGLLVDVARHDALHAEYGTTHVLAVAADVAKLLQRYAGPEALYAIAPAIDLCGETNRSRPRREWPEPLPGADERGLREAVEAEDLELALGLLLGAFDAGLPRAEIEGWLLAVLSDHFLDFGHELIYMVKTRELLDRAGEEHARDLYAGLLLRIVYGTREDTLPYMASYAKWLAGVAPELPDVRSGARPGATLDGPAMRSAVLDGPNAAAACGALWEALSAGVPGERVARELVVAAAERLLRFDLEIDARQDVVENWLWVTHRFTFAAAVRQVLAGWDHPDALRLLFQAVMFLHSGRAMDAPPECRLALESEPATVDDVLAAIAARDPERAVAGALHLLEQGQLVALREALEDLSLRDPLVRPIVVAHVIKVCVATFEELEELRQHPERRVVLAAAVRFLASPVVERRVHEEVTRSIGWVVDGKVPRKLTQ